MKITVSKEVEVKYLDLDVAVRYEDEDMAYDAPLRNGKEWHALIDLDEGRIVNWPQGFYLSFYMKICDEGIYTLLDAEKREVKRKSGYVPNKLLPGDYGDYLSLEIDETGKITNWLSYATLEDFED